VSRAVPITENHDAVRFLKMLSAPSDLILLRPIETRTRGGKRQSTVDYAGVRYERFGVRSGDGWARHDSRMRAMLGTTIDRTDTTPVNLFLDQYVEKGFTGMIRRALLCQLYRKWPEEDGYYLLVERTFGKGCKRAFRTSTRGRKRKS
jgi:hypothetical protein